MSETVLMAREATAMAGKYLTFMLGPEIYGIDILRVQEIIGLLPITRIPKVSRHIRGVINLRGKVIPVMDLAQRFELSAREDTSLTCIVVIELPHDSGVITMGMVVDEVSEVIDIGEENIEGPPDLREAGGSNYLCGLGKVGEQVVILLDVARVLEPAARKAVELMEDEC